MGAIRLDMTMSLDGYVVGPDDSMDAPMGVAGFRLFNWLDHRDDPGPNGQVFAELNATRAVISGRRTYEHAGRWQGDHHDGVPIFVLTHDVPATRRRAASATSPTLVSARRRPAPRPGDADVMVHGAGAAQALLRIGELDELELHVVPVLLGQGRRLFDHLPAEHIELDLLRRLTPDDGDLAHRVMHLRYRVPCSGPTDNPEEPRCPNSSSTSSPPSTATPRPKAGPAGGGSKVPSTSPGWTTTRNVITPF